MTPQDKRRGEATGLKKPLLVSPRRGTEREPSRAFPARSSPEREVSTLPQEEPLRVETTRGPRGISIIHCPAVLGGGQAALAMSLAW